jgi:hypothetical protein
VGRGAESRAEMGEERKREREEVMAVESGW